MYSSDRLECIHISAKTLIKCMIKVDPASRITAKEIRDHPWVRVSTVRTCSPSYGMYIIDVNSLSISFLPLFLLPFYLCFNLLPFLYNNISYPNYQGDVSLELEEDSQMTVIEMMKMFHRENLIESEVEMKISEVSASA